MSCRLILSATDQAGPRRLVCDAPCAHSFSNYHHVKRIKLQLTMSDKAESLIKTDGNTFCSARWLTYAGGKSAMSVKIGKALVHY